jgi:ABC-type multidrug transport system ATPase subunit
MDIMSALRNIANLQTAIVCTIHQPSATIFSFFDKLLLMSKGQMIYFGPAKDAVNFFLCSPFAFPCMDDTNPAEYAISIAMEGIKSSTNDTVPVSTLADYFINHPLKKEFDNNYDAWLQEDYKISNEGIFPAPVQESQSSKLNVSNFKIQNSSYNTSLLRQIYTLLARDYLRLKKYHKFELSVFYRLVSLS